MKENISSLKYYAYHLGITGNSPPEIGSFVKYGKSYV